MYLQNNQAHGSILLITNLEKISPCGKERKYTRPSRSVTINSECNTAYVVRCETCRPASDILPWEIWSVLNAHQKAQGSTYLTHLKFVHCCFSWVYWCTLRVQSFHCAHSGQKDARWFTLGEDSWRNAGSRRSQWDVQCSKVNRMS